MKIGCCTDGNSLQAAPGDFVHVQVRSMEVEQELVGLRLPCGSVRRDRALVLPGSDAGRRLRGQRHDGVHGRYKGVGLSGGLLLSVALGHPSFLRYGRAAGGMAELVMRWTCDSRLGRPIPRPSRIRVPLPLAVPPGTSRDPALHHASGTRQSTTAPMEMQIATCSDQ